MIPRAAATLGIALAVWGSAVTALADTPDRSGESPSDGAKTRSETDGSIVLVTGSLPWGVDADELRARLEKELGTDVVLSAKGRSPRGTLYLDSDDGQITARFRDEDGATTERTMQLPRESARAMDTIVLLSGNVARDEATEIRIEISRRRSTSKKAPPESADVPGEDGPPGADGKKGGSRDEGENGKPGSGPSAGSGSGASAGNGSGASAGNGGGDGDSASSSGSKGSRTGKASRTKEKAPPRPVELTARREPLCSVAPEQPFFWAGVDLVPFLGTSLAARDAVLPMSLDIVGGMAGGIRGVQVGGAVNLVTGSVCGLQVGGAVNLAREGALGVQIGGAANITGPVDGLQIGGAANIAGPTRGIQVSGAVNFGEETSGAQITGGLNIAERLHGVQIAGGLNLAKEATGLQIAGGLNLARETSALQISGGLNLARGIAGGQIAPLNLSIGDVSGVQIGAIELGRDLRGVQIGAVNMASSVEGAQIGAVNVSGRVRGVQLGAINVAEDSDFALGLVSIVRRGRLHLDVWGAETGMMTAALQHGGRYFHNFYGVGIRPLDGQTRMSFTLGFGGHIPLGSTFFMDLDTLASSVHRANDFTGSTALLATARAMVGVHLTRGLALLIGPSYNVGVAALPADASLSAFGTTSLHQTSTIAVNAWPGVTLGAQAF